MQAFNDYYHQFNQNNICLEEKFVHSYHVYGFAKIITEMEAFDEVETKLGLLAAMYHDIGRFSQWNEYHTYVDQDSFDHGYVSAEIFKNEIAPQLDLTPEEIKIVYDAIYYHNKFSIENLDGLTKKLTALVRDADKLDIMSSMYLTSLSNPMDAQLDLNNKVITNNLVEDIISGRMINSKDVKVAIDRVLRHLSWINDFNFDSSIKIIVDHDLFNLKINLIKDDSNLNEVKIIKKYIDDQISKRINFKLDEFYQAKEAFKTYVLTYDLSDYNIKRKFEHSYRVMAEARRIAISLNLNDEDVKLATIIGLLHDVGRFPQLSQFNSFDDNNTIDHADLGAKILFDEGLIKAFWDNEADYETIRFAIANHNKLKIAETNDEHALLYAKIIRDADKLDIIYLEGTLKEYNIKITNDMVSPNIVNNIKEHQPIKKTDILNPNDHIALNYSFVYDLYFDRSLTLMQEYLKEYHNRVNIYHRFDEIYDITTDYLEERIKKYVRK